MCDEIYKYDYSSWILSRIELENNTNTSSNIYVNAVTLEKSIIALEMKDFGHKVDHVPLESPLTNQFPDLIMKDLKIMVTRLPMANPRKISPKKNIKSLENVPERKSNSFKVRCQLCGSYIFTKYLALHICAVHDKVKPYKCDTCAFSASQKGRLRTHKRSVHYKIKEFICDQCDYSAYASCSLKKHVEAVHLKIKNFACNKCNFITSYRTSLRFHHKMVHLKIKDISCDKCHFATKTRHHLKRHVETAHLKIKKV